MVKAVHIETELAQLPVLRGRTPDTPADEEDKAFATLADLGNGAVFAGSFEGESPWERHTKGDELVHILAGETQLTLLSDAGPQVLEMTAGMLTVVPQGCWHRFHAPGGVTVLTVTPQPTDHSTAEDPRQDG
jgi:mannose-6-phosphate isomerase-like protein (cupin superfamily)